MRTRSGTLQRLFAFIFVVLALSAVVFAAIGALQVRSEQDKINVVIDKKKIQDKAEGALETTKEAGSALLERAGEALQNAKPGTPSQPNGQEAPAAATPGTPDAGRPPENARATPDEAIQR